MALDREDPYIQAINDTVFDRAGSYYRTSTPFQVGSDVRSTATDLASGVRGAITRGNANADRYDANMNTQFERGPLMSAARGISDFWSGLTGGAETPASAVAPRDTRPSAPTRVESPEQFVDHVRAASPEAPTRYIPGTPATRVARSAPVETQPQAPGTNGTFSVVGSQDDSWRNFLPANRAEAAPAIQTVNVEPRPSAIQEYMNSSRYRDLSGRGRAGRNQIQLDIKGLDDADTEAGRNARAGSELALRGQELNQRGALESGRWARDAELQNQRLVSEFARDDLRYAADERMANRRGALERDNLDYRYQLEEPERNARIGRLSAETQQLGIENSDKQSGLDLRTRAIDGDRQAMATLQAMSGSKSTTPAEILKDSVDVFASMTPGTEQHRAMARNLMMLGVLNPDGSLRTRGYATGGEVSGAISPQVPQVHPLENMYHQYAMNTQAVGAIPVQFGQFINLVQGSQGNPGNMGMGYAEGGFVDSMMHEIRKGLGIRPKPQTPSQQAQQAQQAQPVQDQPGAVQQEQPRRFRSASERAIEEMDRNGYAQGGAIDVSGHKVIGPGTGTSDSIPAVIDGQQSAALSSGEFVFTDAATESAGSGNLKHIMRGLERGDPTIVAGVIGLAAKAAGSNAKAIQTRV